VTEPHRPTPLWTVQVASFGSSRDAEVSLKVKGKDRTLMWLPQRCEVEDLASRSGGSGVELAEAVDSGKTLKGKGKILTSIYRAQIA
jgi:hypothetical protein